MKLKRKKLKNKTIAGLKCSLARYGVILLVALWSEIAQDYFCETPLGPLCKMIDSETVLGKQWMKV